MVIRMRFDTRCRGLHRRDVTRILRAMNIERLADIRHASGLSQTDVATRLGTRREVVARYESQRDWKLSTVLAYLHACGIGTVHIGGLTVATECAGTCRDMRA